MRVSRALMGPSWTRGARPPCTNGSPDHGDSIVTTADVPTPEHRIAVVTGGNHGIGAATAIALATTGVDVLVAYLRLEPDPAAGLPPAYHDTRAAGADAVLAAVAALPGRAAALEV